MSRAHDLALAQDLSENGQLDDAYIIANRYLKHNPNDPEFLTIMVHVLLSSQKPAVAYSLAKRVTQIAPRSSGAWLNMGMAAGDLWIHKEAVRSYKKALTLAFKEEQKLLILINMCAVLIDSGHFEEAEPYAKKAIEIDPENLKAISNLGFCQLAQRNWKEGWPNYHKCLGISWRPATQYFNEPEWDGKKTGRVVLYAEQGLGDVLSFASMVPDAQKKAKIVLDIDAKLQGLLQRSFPKASVYGTRLQQDNLPWRQEDTEIDASLSMGQIAEFFRLRDEDFPGTPYLIPDPDRVFMWKSLFKKKKKPVIGIAWRGGIMKTGSKYRQWDLEQLLPILKLDAHWVSLQYKPAAQEIEVFKKKHPEIDIVEYPHGTLTNDYDDTAAMVAAMDHVVCMQTAVTHLCGGLGVPVWVFIPKNSQWRYGGGGEDYIWAKSVRIIRQQVRGEWEEDIKRVGGELSALFRKVPKTASKTTPSRKLRSNRKKIRGNGIRDHRQAGNQQPA